MGLTLESSSSFFSAISKERTSLRNALGVKNACHLKLRPVLRAVWAQWSFCCLLTETASAPRDDVDKVTSDALFFWKTQRPWTTWSQQKNQSFGLCKTLAVTLFTLHLFLAKNTLVYQQRNECLFTVKWRISVVHKVDQSLYYHR